MAHPARRGTREVDRHSTGALVPLAGPIDRRPLGTGPGTDVPVLFAIITDYGDESPLDAAAGMWRAAQTECPGAVVHVIHPRDGNLTRDASGTYYFRGIELETVRQALR